jgi:hypothetical protein
MLSLPGYIGTDPVWANEIQQVHVCDATAVASCSSARLQIKLPSYNV